MLTRMMAIPTPKPTRKPPGFDHFEFDLTRPERADIGLHYYPVPIREWEEVSRLPYLHYQSSTLVLPILTGTGEGQYWAPNDEKQNNLQSVTCACPSETRTASTPSRSLTF